MKESLDKFDIIKGFLIICTIVFFVACLHQPKDSKTPFQDVYTATIQNIDVSNMEQKDNQAIKRFLLLSPDLYNNIVYLKDTNSMGASEIVIVEFKNNQQAKAFEEAMRNRQKAQKNVFDGYIEEQATLVKKSIIYTRANYGIFIVHSDCETILTQFKEAL